MKSPWKACLLSFFVPGLGQLYLREKMKGVSLLCITGGLVFALALNRSWLGLLLMGPLCLFVMVPAAIDAYQTASGKRKKFKSDSVPYVILMLLAVGPFAFPLLWQSPKFSRGAKIIWTVLITLIALGVILVMASLVFLFDKIASQDLTVPF